MSNVTRGEIIGIKEAARRMHISPSLLYRWKNMGQLPFKYLQPSPSKYFFDSADIDDYMAKSWRNTVSKENQ